MLNHIVIMGRLVRDPELRTTQSGVSVTSFTLAVDRDFKNPSGEKSTDFIDVVAWRQTAEFVCKYFGKGRMAVAEGRLQIRDWKATTAAARRLSPTTCISATASGTAPPATATAARPPMGILRPRPLTAAGMAGATAPPPPSPPASRRLTIRTGTCPSDGRSAPLCRPCGAARNFHLESARDLRGPGLCAYFWPTPKVGKSVLKPTV